MFAEPMQTDPCEGEPSPKRPKVAEEQLPTVSTTLQALECLGNRQPPLHSRATPSNVAGFSSNEA
eukprot:821751-Amphidinium_carterae.1